MGCREIAGVLSLYVVWLGGTGSALAQTTPPFVPEFKLVCHPTAAVMDAPPEDPSADRFGDGPWYINDDRSIWAGWQPLVSGRAGNRIMWIKPPGQKLKIAGRRIDGESSPLEVEKNDSYVSKGFEPNRLFFPEDGCWEVTAKAGKEELVFVVEVKSAREGAR